jgi:hypothetical protein
LTRSKAPAHGVSFSSMPRIAEADAIPNTVTTATVASA